MKFLALISLLVASILGLKITIISPWGSSEWISGSQATIKYEVSEGIPSEKDVVSVQLMSGNPLNGLLVATIAENVPLTKRTIAWQVPDYPSNEDYFVRIGTKDNWFFSHTFKLLGSGKIGLPEYPKPEIKDVKYNDNSYPTDSYDVEYPKVKGKLELGSADSSSSMTPSTASNSQSASPSASSGSSSSFSMKTNSTKKASSSSNAFDYKYSTIVLGFALSLIFRL